MQEANAWLSRHIDKFLLSEVASTSYPRLLQGLLEGLPSVCLYLSLSVCLSLCLSVSLSSLCVSLSLSLSLYPPCLSRTPLSPISCSILSVSLFCLSILPVSVCLSLFVVWRFFRFVLCYIGSDWGARNYLVLGKSSFPSFSFPSFALWTGWSLRFWTNGHQCAAELAIYFPAYMLGPNCGALRQRHVFANDLCRVVIFSLLSTNSQLSITEPVCHDGMQREH